MAARVLRSEQELRQCLGYLSRDLDHGAKLPLIGVIQNTLRKRFIFEAVVDAWPDFSAIVLRPVQGVALNKNFEVFRLMYAKDPKKMDNLLRVPGILPWDNLFFINALSDHLASAVSSVCADHGCSATWKAEYQVTHYTTDLDDNYNLPKGFYFDKLKPEHASLINQMWEFGGTKRQEDRIRFLIENFMSWAVYNEKDEPVTWSIEQFDGAFGMSVTLPNYRKMGLATALWKHQIITFKRSGNICFGMAATDNTNSLSVASKLQGKRMPDHVVYVTCLPTEKNKTAANL